MKEKKRKKKRKEERMKEGMHECTNQRIDLMNQWSFFKQSNKNVNLDDIYSA